MTHRILCSLMILGALYSNAHAAPGLPNGQCFEINGGADYNMIIYFENDFPNVNDTNFEDINGMFRTAANGATECYRQMLDALKTNVIDKITQEDEAIFLLASTDTLAEYDYNIELAGRRAAFATDALFTAGLSANALTNQVKVFIGGESNAASGDTKATGSNPKERAIRIIVKQANNYTPPATYQEVNLTNIINNTANFTYNATFESSSKIEVQKNTIRTLALELDNISRDFGRSHWKTASGNFNGARLASDSIAGVVLGTAGGLITSNVMKKNQVRDGFEDLQCVIGGQVVANYKDEFTTNLNTNRQ